MALRSPVFSASRRVGVVGLVLMAALSAALLGLRQLAYSRASLRAVDLDEAAAPPRPLDLDGLSWDPGPYQTAAALKPIRDDVRTHCPNLGAYATASCLMNLFARRFPHGTPPQELFSARFDPAAVWRQHLAGAPGHCVSRSGMLATALLASGIPARVVQIISRREHKGHNVAEVWQAGDGWRVFDPSFAGHLQPSDGIESAVGLITAPYPRWTFDPTRAKVAGVDEAQALGAYNERDLSGAAIVYPEPWLYTRVGTSVATFPFRGRFVIVGPRSWMVGLGQPLLQLAVALSLLGLATTVGWMLWRPRVRRSIDVVKEGFAPGQELADF